MAKAPAHVEIKVPIVNSRARGGDGTRTGGSFNPQLLLMGLYEFEHTVEFEVDLRHLARIHGGPKTLLGVPPVDPAGLQPVIVCRLVVVEHALRRMQDLLFLHTDPFQLLDHVIEIAGRRLVRPDVFRGVDRIELHLQLPIACLETLVVHVGEYEQLEILLQILQRSGRVFKRRPIPHRSPVLDTILVGRVHTPLLGKALVDDRQQVPISLRRSIVLLAVLVTRMRLKNLVAGQLAPHPTGEALQRLDHPALPVDQGAVAVEGECVEIRKQHVDFSSFIGAAKSCKNGYELHRSSPLRFIYQNVNPIPAVGSNSDVLRYENAKPPLNLEYATPA